MDGTTHADANGHTATLTALGTAAAGTDRAHASFELASIRKQLRRLHNRVCSGGQRVEVTRAGCDDVCVLISKRELEAMEAALNLYASHPSHADLCRGLAQLLADAGVVHRPKGYDGQPVETFADDCAAA